MGLQLVGFYFWFVLWFVRLGFGLVSVCMCISGLVGVFVCCFTCVLVWFEFPVMMLYLGCFTLSGLFLGLVGGFVFDVLVFALWFVVVFGF